MTELAAHGPEGLSVQRVAERAEVNKTTVYRRWPTRDALIDAALERVLAEASALPPTGSVRGDLGQILNYVVELLESPGGRALLRAAMAEEGGGGLPSVHGRLGLESRDEGQAGRDGALPTAAFMLVGTVIHRVLLERRLADAAWQERIVDLLVSGLGEDVERS